MKTARSRTRANMSVWLSTAPGLVIRLRLTFMFEVSSLLTSAAPLPAAIRVTACSRNGALSSPPALPPECQQENCLSGCVCSENHTSSLTLSFPDLSASLSRLCLLGADLCILLLCSVVTLLDLPNLTVTWGDVLTRQG